MFVSVVCKISTVALLQLYEKALTCSVFEFKWKYTNKNTMASFAFRYGEQEHACSDHPLLLDDIAWFEALPSSFLERKRK